MIPRPQIPIETYQVWFVLTVAAGLMASLNFAIGDAFGGVIWSVNMVLGLVLTTDHLKERESA